MARYDSFILRVWRSTGENGAQWAGRLDHLQQGRSWQFRSLEELVSQLRQLAEGTSVADAVPMAGLAAPDQPGEESG